MQINSAGRVQAIKASARDTKSTVFSRGIQQTGLVIWRDSNCVYSLPPQLPAVLLTGRLYVRSKEVRRGF